jgi:hypothetical protein
MSRISCKAISFNGNTIIPFLYGSEVWGVGNDGYENDECHDLFIEVDIKSFQL